MDANTPLRGHLSESARAAALAACAVFAVAAAVLLQLLLSLYPCPWCILQRYAFLAFGAVMTLGAFTGAPSTRARLVLAAGLVALSGAAMAGFQLYGKLVPSGACGKDAVAEVVNSLWLAKLLPLVFEATGSCTDPIPLNFPLLSLGGFVVLGVGALAWVRRA